MDENNLPRLNNIVISGQDDKIAYISEGLKEGDVIVMTGIQAVIPGQTVKIANKTQNQKEVQKNKKPSLISRVKNKIKKILKKGNKN